MLETKRLILRQFKKEDLNDFYEYAKVEGVGERAGWPHHNSLEDSKKILDLFIKDEYVFAVVYKENNKVIGSIGIHETDTLDAKEIGYVISKDYWDRGIATEAVKRVIIHAFCSLGVNILYCGHFNENLASKRVIEKSGFTFICDYIYNAKALNLEFPSKKYILKKEECITDTLSLIGQEVSVIVDRKIGSKHPNNNTIYKLNYGYIPNTLALDEEEVDAYIMGVKESVDSFKGVVIAVIERLNDSENKLVVAPKNMSFSNSKIKRKTRFMEKYYKIRIRR